MNQKTFIIIQARLGSSRLKEKVLKKIGKFTLLEIMMIRLSFLNMNSNIYFAIPNNAQNDKLNNFLKEKNFNVLRGSENKDC